MVKCYFCEKETEKEYYSSYYDAYICKDCINNNCVLCVRCGEYFEGSDTYIVEDECYCSDCANDLNVCEDCNNYALTIHTTYYGNVICDECYRESYFTCSRCGEIYHIDDSNGDICLHCFEEEEKEEEELIREYSYKPHFKGFYNRKEIYQSEEKNLIGFELEVEREGNNVNDILSEYNNNHFYFKRDGSLNNGFEIVSYPFNQLYYKEKLKMHLKNLLDALKGRGCKSYIPKTCGFHGGLGKVSRPL